MPIPDFQTLMRPVLEAHEDGGERSRGPLLEDLAQRFELTEEERAERLPSGTQRRFDNRLAWTTTHLAQAGLLERPRRGVTRLTDRGRQVLREEPARVDISVLNRFPEYLRFRGAATSDGQAASGETNLGGSSEATPEEAMQAAYTELNAAVAEELLAKVLGCDSAFFEQLVVDVLIAMGYGGSKAEAGERLGQSGDGGIDGVIREDLLGLDAIYLQAKRWDPSRAVGRPEVQAFVGALQGARTSKGVFITTSQFSSQAQQYAASINAPVVLIDGRRLARLMIEYGVGVTVRQTYYLKRIDEDYFANDVL